MVLRHQITEALCAALGAHDQILAFWEDGSTATGLADEWSDIDLGVIVRNGSIAQARLLAEGALTRLAPIARHYEVHYPAETGTWQAYYRLEGSPDWLLIDLSIYEERAANKYDEPEAHGRSRIYFDKEQRRRQPPSDPQPVAERLRRRVTAIATSTELFHHFVEKEVRRGRLTDACHWYQAIIMAKLIEALRMRYSPWRSGFGLRYLRHDLPAEVYRQVERLCFVSGPDQLLPQKEEALALIRQTLAALQEMDLEALLEQARDPQKD